MAGKRDKKATGSDERAPGMVLRGIWSEQIDEAVRRYGDFHREGEEVVRRYRLEKENQKNYWQDKYNILYSTTETMKPSLYSDTPKVQATNRHKDRENDTALLAVMLIEAATQYAMEEIDFDDVMENVVEDYILPGLGLAWVRYEPQFTTIGEGEEAYEDLTFEGLAVDYVHYKDFVSDDVRVWREKKWIARRVYFNKTKAKKRFGEEKANRLAYTHVPSESKQSDVRGKEAIIWEIWDRDNREVIWYSGDYPDDVLDQKSDFLRLKDFFPCPRPLRAVHSTSTFIPRAFYSQYKAQAETLDDITQRIRFLTKALRVIGVFDSENEALSKLLAGNDNRMVPVENWAAFAGQGGMDGSVQWVPIKDVALVLGELYKQRDIAKNEIYEITGFSDIVRGVSKASETLGAQEIKNNWATGRLRSVQKEVQRFCRDIIRIKAEIICEHFDNASLALYAGFEPPPVTPEEQQAAAQYAAQQLQYQQQGGMTLGQPAPQPPPPTQRQQALEKFKEVVQLLKTEKTRCALVGIETDSTIQPDEAQERKDRMEFLGQIGAFLQQAGPMALQYPDMRGLLGAIMMFTIRTFRASRPLEKEFEDFQKKLAAAPPMAPGGQGEGGGGDPHAAQAQVQGEDIKAKAAVQQNNDKLQMEKYKADLDAQLERERMQADHEYRMAQLNLERQKLSIEQGKALLQANQTQRQEDRADDAHEHDQSMDLDGAERADRQLEADQAAAANSVDSGD